MVSDATIAKAQHLRTLSQRGGTPDEAKAAARALAKLLQRHRIDEAQLDGYIEAFTSSGDVFVARRIPLWRRDLFNHVCRALGVAPFLYGRRRRGPQSLRMHGTREDVASAKFLFDWISEACVRLCRKACRGRGRRAATQWRNGFVHATALNLPSAREQGTPSEQRALVLIDTRVTRAMADFESKYGPKPVQIYEARIPADPTAYMAGYMAGQSLSLEAALKEGNTA